MISCHHYTDSWSIAVCIHFTWNPETEIVNTFLHLIKKSDEAKMNSTANESSSDSYTENSSADLYIEIYSTTVKMMYLTIGIFSAVCSTFAIIILHRTKRVPDSAKFLSSGLLIFDFMFITLSTTRKFVTIPVYNTNMNVISNAFIQLAYITVGLMALERFVMFYRPMLYMKFCTKRSIRVIAVTSWIATVITFYAVRYGVCYLKFASMHTFTKAGLCNQIVTIYYSLLVVLVLSISMFCYCNIFRFVKNQATVDGKNLSFRSTASLLRSYKSTSLVLVFFSVILSTSIAYVIILVYIRQMGLGVTEIRVALDGVSIVNCFLDPFLYVLWFKESQMELYKILSVIRCLQTKADRMRYKVFSIVTVEERLRKCRGNSLKH